MAKKLKLGSGLENLINEKINKLVYQSQIDLIEATTDAIKEVFSYTIKEKGYYFIDGFLHLNYYGGSGRELIFDIYKNNEIIYKHIGVINASAYTLTTPFVCSSNFQIGDIVKVVISNTNTNNWALNGGNIQFIKLN